MASIKTKALSADALINEIKTSVEKDLKKNPGKVLDSHVGDVIESNCSKCGKTTVEILTNGKAKCTKCGRISKVNLEISFK